MEMVAQTEAPRDLALKRRAALAVGATALLVGVAAFGTARDSHHSVARATASASAWSTRPPSWCAGCT